VVVTLDAYGAQFTETPHRGDYAWHWKINPPDQADIDWGHSMTLIEAMTDFRQAWDAHVRKTAMKRVRD